MVVGRFQNNSGAPALLGLKSRAAVGSNTIVQDDDNIFSIHGHCDDGTDYASICAEIFMSVDGTPGANDTPGRITFKTTADGAATSTERMRIASNGDTMIGTTDHAGGGIFKVQNSAGEYTAGFFNSHGSTPYGLVVRFSGAAPDESSNYHFLQCFDNTETVRLTIWSDGDVTTSDAGTLTSDARLKTNIVDATDKLPDLMRLKVRNFEWIPEYHPAKVGEKKIGFIAQELEEVFPSLVRDIDIAGDNSIEEQLYTEEDEIPEGKQIGDVKVAAKDHEPTIRKSVKNALVPILVKALQELTVRVETLEAA